MKELLKHTIDYDLKPSNSSRVYGWVSQVNTEELGNKKQVMV